MKRKIAAILAADIAGYSRLVAENEEETISRLGSYREVFDALIKQYGGRIFNTAGDAVMAEFPSTVEAVRCAVDVQESLKTRNLSYPPDRQMHFRIGISVADVIERDGDLLGDGVNIAARLEGLATPGGICVSRSVYEQVSNKAAIQFSDIGEQQVKNIPTPVHAYRVGDLGPMAAAVDAAATVGPRAPAFPVLAAAGAGAAVLIGIAVWAVWPESVPRPPPPPALSQAPQPQATRPSTAAPFPSAQPTSAGSVVARLTILSAPPGSSCQAQVMETNPRFVEAFVELATGQPVIELEGGAICGLAISGSGGTQARFAEGTVVQVLPSFSTPGRIVFNPSSSGARLPDIAITGAAVERIELRRK
jgi:class 3 adenylate cyclase